MVASSGSSAPDGEKDITWPSLWWPVPGSSLAGAITELPAPARKKATFSSRWNKVAASARMVAVLAATFASKGDGQR